MSYSCRLYINSGFNSVNIPDSPAILESSAIRHVDVPALDILQERFLNKIRVKAEWDNICNCDYLRLVGGKTDWFYSVEGIVMTSKDVAELTVIPDYITSIGGVDELRILDGVTQRVHVGDDGFGLWDAEDPLLTPIDPLVLFSDIQTINENLAAGRSTLFLESTFDPVQSAYRETAVTYKNADGEEKSVSVPRVYSNGFQTQYTVTNTYVPGRGTGLYEVDIDTVPSVINSAISICRGLGIESGIIRQYVVPNYFLGEMEKMSFSIPDPADPQQFLGYNMVYHVNGVQKTIGPANMPRFSDCYDTSNGYYTIRNNLITYSNLCKYGMITAAGNSCEYNPKDLYNGTGINSSPYVTVISDPRPQGKPYYRFTWVNGKDDFWRNCLAGSEWINVPLIYEGASGSALNTMRLENEQKKALLASAQYDSDYAYDTMKRYNDMFTTGAVGALDAVNSGLHLDVLGGASRAISTAGQLNNMIFDQQRADANLKMYNLGYQLDRRSEMMDLHIANNVVAPTVAFPYDGDTFRDITGGGFMYYKYLYTKWDVQRIDKLLTMYGYQVSKALVPTDFTNRQYFNYVMCNDVSIGGNAKWINDGIASQLKAGVRVWHTRPNPDYYYDNPIV